MKNIFWIVALLLIAMSCSKNENEMFLTGNVKGLKKGTILLKKVNDTNMTTVDSVVVNGNAAFSFSEIIESPQLYTLQLKIENESLKDKEFFFFAEPGEISISTSLENFATAAVIKGSKNHDKLSEYQKMIQRYSNRNLDLIEEELTAMQQGNDSLAEAAQKKQQNTLTGKYLATVNFAINNKDYELAPYLMLSEAYAVNIKYLDTVYGSLTPKIKDSKYGKALESYIEDLKKSEE